MLDDWQNIYSQQFGQDYVFLQQFLKNKQYVDAGERDTLEDFVIKGIPEGLRRQYWLAVSGAYGYLKNYSDGYYATLSKDGDESAYPDWPHPDYCQIQKDIKRTFSDEEFFKIQGN